MPGLLAAILVVSVSGFVTYFFPEHGIWPQWTFLLHTLSGFYLVCLLIPYLFLHFRRAIASRRELQLLFGLMTVIFFLAVSVTGLYISIFGQYEKHRWLYELHIFISYAVILGLVTHLLIHYFQHQKSNYANTYKGFTTITATTLKTIAYVSLSCFVIIIGTTFLYNITLNTYTDKPTVQPYELPYGDAPFFPSEAQTVSGTFVDKRRVGGSERCGVCHEEIMQQWRSSMHGQSATDRAFQTNMHSLIGKKGIAATRFCLGCHGPVALLSGQVATNGKLDPSEEAIKEGVSCMACHGIRQEVHLKGVGSYLFEPQKDYLFADRDNYFLTRIHNYLIDINPRQHRKDMARPIIYSPKNCATCHVQYIDKELNDWGWIKLQDQYSSWLNGPFSGISQGGDHTFSRQETKRCQDCHFPLVVGDDPSADKVGLIRSHRNVGANTAIPWLNGDREQFEQVKSFLQDDRIKLMIRPQGKPNTGKNQPQVEPSVNKASNDAVIARKGTPLTLDVVVASVGIGHNFPAGTIDLNEPWIHYEVTDANGRLVYESGGLMENNDVDPNAHFYYSVGVNRQGKHVWKHDLFNLVGTSYENLIHPGKSDIVSYTFLIPAWAIGPLKVSARLRYRKFNNKYARWALKDENIELPIIDMARDVLLVHLSDEKLTTENQHPKSLFRYLN